MSPDLDLSRLSGLVRALGTAENRDQMLDAMAETLPAMMQVDRSSVALPRSATHMQIFAFGGAVSDERATWEIPIETSMLGRAARQNRMLVLDDLTGSAYHEMAALAEAGLRSAMVAPISVGDTCLGTVNLASRYHGFFTPPRQELARAVAELIAGSLNLMRLAERERSRAMIDGLTGCLSRSAILDHLDGQFGHGGHRPSVIYLDLNGFKLINDVHGHHVGDRILTIVARRITSRLGSGEHLGRLGGDEFLIVVDEDDRGHRAEAVARSLPAVSEEPIAVDRLEITATFSIGVANPALTANGTAGELMADADQAMYRSKRSARTIVVADEEIHRHTSMLSAIDRDLDRAMDQGALVLHYQPVCWLDTGTIAGVEALVRWEHPEYGWIPAPLLIDRIEATGRTASFTRWCIESATRDLAVFRRALPALGEGRVGVNLSPRQLALPQCAELLVEACDRHGLRPSDVLIEVIESAAISVGGQAEETLGRFAAIGATIVLDDFGTGDNALRYFTRFPVHGIKFDRSLVGALTTTPEARKILQAMAIMSRDLDLSSVAEGIETEEELEACRGLGLLFGQGWLLGRPAPRDELIAARSLEGSPLPG